LDIFYSLPDKRILIDRLPRKPDNAYKFEDIMKARILFLVISFGILTLLAVAGLLTMQFIQVAEEELPSASPRLAPRTPQSDSPVVGGKDIVVPASAHAEIPKAYPAVKEPAPEDRPEDVPAPAPAPEGPMARITAITGRVLSVDSAGKSRALTLQSEVRLGETIQTLENSRIGITFLDGTTLHMADKSTVVMEEYMFTPADKGTCSFLLRATRGMFRVISGKLTALNPDRFRVKTRMATIGIRGCEVAFACQDTREDVYILTLGGQEKVEVETAEKGRILFDAAGNNIPLDGTSLKTISVSDPMTHIVMELGIAPASSKLSPAGYRSIQSGLNKTSALRHQAHSRPDETTFIIKPDGNQSDKPEETAP
jgi:hypothetical protein